MNGRIDRSIFLCTADWENRYVGTVQLHECADFFVNKKGNMLEGWRLVTKVTGERVNFRVRVLREDNAPTLKNLNGFSEGRKSTGCTTMSGVDVARSAAYQRSIWQ